jgi:uncharacterized Zn finger protein
MEKLCKKCGVVKPFALMRKNGKNTVNQCNACANEVKKAYREKMKTKEPVVIVEVPIKSFKYTPYVPEKVHVRNNGNVHIQSRGFQC